MKYFQKTQDSYYYCIAFFWKINNIYQIIYTRCSELNWQCLLPCFLIKNAKNNFLINIAPNLYFCDFRSKIALLMYLQFFKCMTIPRTLNLCYYVRLWGPFWNLCSINELLLSLLSWRDVLLFTIFLFIRCLTTFYTALAVLINYLEKKNWISGIYRHFKLQNNGAFRAYHAHL